MDLANFNAALFWVVTNKYIVLYSVGTVTFVVVIVSFLLVLKRWGAI